MEKLIIKETIKANPRNSNTGRVLFSNGAEIWFGDHMPIKKEKEAQEVAAIFLSAFNQPEKLSVSKEFVLAAYKAACKELRDRIELEFPKLFKLEFEKGVWVKWVRPNPAIGRIITKVGDYYHLDVNGNLSTHGSCHFSNLILLTKEEIESHLIALAGKKGFKSGARVKTPRDEYTGTCIGGYVYSFDKDVLYCGTYAVYSKGKWATIIEEPKTYTFYRNDCEKDTEITFKSTSELKAKDRLAEIVGCDYNNYKLKN